MFSSSLVSESFSSLPPDDRFFRNNFVTKSKCQNVLICWKPGRQRCGPIFDYQYSVLRVHAAHAARVFLRGMHFKKLQCIMFPKSSKTSNLLTWYQRSLHGRLRTPPDLNGFRILPTKSRWCNVSLFYAIEINFLWKWNQDGFQTWGTLNLF